MRMFTVAAALLLVSARPGRAVDLPALVDQALEPVLTAAVAVAGGDRPTGAARAASVPGFVAAALAGGEDPVAAAALGRKAKAFRKGMGRLRATATHAGTMLARGRGTDAAAMRALKKASRAGLKVVRLLAAMPVPGIVVMEEDVRAAGFYAPGTGVTLRIAARDDGGMACAESPLVTVVNLFGGAAVDPTPADLGGGRVRVTMAATGGAARIEVSACGHTASPGRVLFNAGPTGPGNGGGDTWTVGEIMAGSGVGLYPEIALDAAGGPHVVSVNLGTDTYEYSTRTGDAWTTEVVSTAAQSCGGNVGVLSDIALAGDGTPHVSLEIPDQAVQHGVRTGGWSVSDVSTTLCPFTSPSVDQAYAFVGDNAIAIDPSGGTVWIVGWVYNGIAGRRAVGAWHSGPSGMALVDEGTIGGDTSTGRHPGVAVDATGGVHVVYEGYTGTSVVRYAQWTGSGWTASTLADGSGNSGKSTAVAIDPGNRPHVVFLRSSEGHKHAVWNGAGWDVDLVTSDTAAAGNAWVDLAIDGGGTVHVVYSSVSGAVRYVRGTAGNWSAPVTIAAEGDHPAIAVTAAGAPQVVFEDPAGNRLAYATRAP